MALLKGGTRIYGFGTVDGLLTVGSIATSNSTPLVISSSITRSSSNTTGTIVITNGGGLATRGNIYSGNIVITGAVNSNGITFTDGTRQTRSGLEKGNTRTQTVTGPVIFSDSTSADNSSSGALVVTGGIGAREGYFQYNVNVSDAILGGTYLKLGTGNFGGANWTDAYTAQGRGGIQTNATSHTFVGGGLNNGTLWFNQFTSPTIDTVNSRTNGNVATVLIQSPIINASNTFLANVVPYSLWANGSIFTANNIIAANNIIVRGAIIDDQGNNTIIFGRSSPVLIQNTTASTSNTTGALVVTGGLGVAGNTFLNNSLAAVTTTTSAVNYLQVTGNTTSNPISLSAQGSGSDVSMNLVSKGAGSINFISQGAPVVTMASGSSPFGTIASPFIFSPTIPGAWGSKLTLPGDTTATIQTPDSSSIRFGTFGGTGVGSYSGNTQFQITHTGSAVNYIQVTGNTTSNGPVLSAEGTSTNIGININPKGAGSVNITSITTSTSNTTGALVVRGGVGVTGNIYVGGTNAGANGIYTDNLRYSSNGQPWVVGVPSTAWTSYTPTITAASGSFTTVSATGAYQIIGKTCFVTVNISITTAGTAAGGIYATLPFTSAARIQIGGYGMEVNSTGNMLKGYIPTSSTQLQITTYSNGSTIGDGYSPILTVVYEIA